MKTPSPRLPALSYRLHISAALMTIAIINSHAACSNGGATITTVPHLGGSSYVVTALNAVGQVTGASQLPGDLEEHAFLFGPGGLTDLGTLGGFSSYAAALNDFGQVAGESGLADEFVPPHAFLHDGITMIDLGALDGSFSTALGINNAGHVTGNVLTAGSTVEAFLFANGAMQSLGHLGGFYSQAAAINQSSAIAGNSLTDTFDQHAFLYTNGVMLDLGSLGGGYSDAFGVNDNNVVVGESYLASGELHGFVYANGTMTDVGTLGGNYSSAYRINNAGQVIGMSTTLNDARTTGFVYENGALIELGTLGGATSTPFAINNAGQIVGQSDLADGSQSAFLWENGTITDLNSILPTNSGWTLGSAQFINDSGRIVGLGSYNGQEQWYIFDPAGGEANHPPTANAGSDQTVECSGSVTLDGTLSSDPDDDSLTYEWSEVGTILSTNANFTISFAAGIHSVTLTVSDPCGAISQDTVTVTVGDSTPPTIVCPANVNASSPGSCEALIPDLRPLVTISDNCTPSDQLIVTQSPAPGTTIGSGPYPITLTVTDAAGNTAECTTTITAGDDQPPRIVCLPRPFTVSANSNCEGKVPDLKRYVSARDNCTPSKALVITQTPAAGTMLEKGEHTILVSVTDNAGNTSTRSVTFRIKDRTPPRIHNILATPNTLTSAMGESASVHVTVEATDNCDPSPTSKIVKILCGDKVSRHEMRITGPLTAQLAIPRGAYKNGRIYKIVVVCEDNSGNKTYKTVTVRIPKTYKNGHRR